MYQIFLKSFTIVILISFIFGCSDKKVLWSKEELIHNSAFIASLQKGIFDNIFSFEEILSSYGTPYIKNCSNGGSIEYDISEDLSKTVLFYNECHESRTDNNGTYFILQKSGKIIFNFKDEIIDSQLNTNRKIADIQFDGDFNNTVTIDNDKVVEIIILNESNITTERFYISESENISTISNLKIMKAKELFQTFDTRYTIGYSKNASLFYMHPSFYNGYIKLSSGYELSPEFFLIENVSPQSLGISKDGSFTQGGILYKDGSKLIDIRVDDVNSLKFNKNSSTNVHYLELNIEAPSAIDISMYLW